MRQPLDIACRRLLGAACVSERRDEVGRARLLDRVRCEFGEMPGMRLTPAQARRLFALRADVCDRVLTALVDEGTLARDRNGRYGLRATLRPA